MIADLIKQVQEEIPVPGDLEDAGIENAIHLPNIGIATYEHNPEHDVYIVTLTLDKGGEVREYVLNPNGLKDLIELGTKYFYDEMESQTFSLNKASDKNIINHMDYHGGLSYDESEYLLDNWSNCADHDEVILAAESLGVPITDIEDDDVENFLEMGGNYKGEEESSIGTIQWIYDNKLKAYLILMILNDKPIMYKIDPDMMKEWKDSDSMGEYYNNRIRGNSTIEDPKHSCGCGPNPCESGQVDQYKTKYSSIL